MIKGSKITLLHFTFIGTKTMSDIAKKYVFHKVPKTLTDDPHRPAMKSHPVNSAQLYYTLWSTEGVGSCWSRCSNQQRKNNTI
jgi:hypothetical protein